MACYLVRAGKTENVKIGFAVAVKRRIAELQSAHWERLIILRTWDGDRMSESWLHGQFKHVRVARDWFIFDPDMMSIEIPIRTQPARSSSSFLLEPEILEARAKANGLTVGAMCLRAGIAQSTFTRWKNGTTSPGIEIYRRLLAAISATSVASP